MPPTTRNSLALTPLVLLTTLITASPTAYADASAKPLLPDPRDSFDAHLNAIDRSSTGNNVFAPLQNGQEDILTPNPIPSPPQFSVSLFDSAVPEATRWPFVQTDSAGMNTLLPGASATEGMVGSMTSAVGSFFAQTTAAGNAPSTQAGAEPSTGILTMTSVPKPLVSATATKDGAGGGVENISGNAQTTMPVQTDNPAPRLAPGRVGGDKAGMGVAGLVVAGLAVVCGGLLL